MHIEQFRDYCLTKKGVTEDFPFDELTLCVRVMWKIFAITGLDAANFSVNLKCDPDYAVELRERYPEITPGWHMNKKHWNTIIIDGSVSGNIIKEWIDHSYELIDAGNKPLKKKKP